MIGMERHAAQRKNFMQARMSLSWLTVSSAVIKAFQ